MLFPTLAGWYRCARPSFLGAVIAPACLLLDVPRSTAAIPCRARSSAAIQMLLHLPSWGSPSPPSLFSSKGAPPPRYLSGWEGGRQFYSIPTACQPLGPKSLPSMLSLIWMPASSSFWGGAAPLVPPLAIYAFHTLLEVSSTPDLRSPVWHSPVGGIELAGVSVYCLLNVRAPLLPPAAAFYAKALVRPTLLTCLQEAAVTWGSWGRKMSQCSQRYFLSQRGIRSRLHFLTPHLLSANTGRAAPGVRGIDK